MANKFNAKKVTVSGITYDSKKEALRGEELRRLEKAGKISGLQRQVEFLLIPEHRKSDGTLERKCTYKADFVYTLKEPIDGGQTVHNFKRVVEDVKGCRFGAAFEVYKIKRKLMLDKYGIEIKEI